MKSPRTLADLQKHARVADAYREEDSLTGESSVWAHMVPGWECTLSGCHTVHEGTVREAIAAVLGAVPCDCGDCVAELARSGAALVGLA